MQGLGVKADRAGELADVAAKAPVADVRRHERIGAVQPLRVPGIGHREKGRQLDALQLLQRLVHGGHLIVGQAVAAPVAGKVPGHGAHLVLAAGVDAANVGPSHLAHPVRVPAKDARAQIALATGAWVGQHVYRRSEQHVDPQGGQFAPDDLAGLFGQVRVPRGADGHWAGQRSGAVGDLRVGKTITLVLNGDQERDA